MTVQATEQSWTWQGHRLVYETYGDGPRTFVYVHGLLLDAGLNREIAQLLAGRGYHVILPELLGHGRSDRPTHAYSYRIELWADQVASLLDHLELDDAVVGGVSLGANVTLQLAQEHPERVRAMILEMPVLERGTLVGAALFLPVIVGLRYAPSLFTPLSLLARALPKAGHPLDAFVNLLAANPRELAAVLHGLFVGPSTPMESVRRNLDIPALVLGHGYDMLHALDDAQALADELPDATFVRLRTIVEARTRPQRAVDAMDGFLRRAYAPQGVPDTA